MKILVAEDDEGIREAISIALQSQGYSTILTSNGQEALEWLEHQRNSSSEPPDLILSDIHMPFMNGIELFKMLKALKWKPIPFIFMTAQAHSTQESAHSIKKPFELDLLLQTIRTELENYEK